MNINFDRLSVAKASLEEFCSCLERVTNNEYLWQYAIISIHNSLQGYIVAGIISDDGLHQKIWKESKDKEKEKWDREFSNYIANQGIRVKDDLTYEAYELKIPELDFFMKLFDKASFNKKLIKRENINSLNAIRNNFIHFNTGYYSLERDYIIDCCYEALKVLKLIPDKFTKIFQIEEKKEFDRLCNYANKLAELQRTEV